MWAILLKIGTVLALIFQALSGLTKTAANAAKSFLEPFLNYLLNHWIAIVAFGVFGGIALNLMGTMLAFTLYHLSATITIVLSPMVTPFTIGLLVNFVMGVFFLFMARFIIYLLK